MSPPTLPHPNPNAEIFTPVLPSVLSSTLSSFRSCLDVVVSEVLRSEH
jgi:hypothetical protein